jgi:hypothetical protein
MGNPLRYVRPFHLIYPFLFGKPELVQTANYIFANKSISAFPAGVKTSRYCLHLRPFVETIIKEKKQYMDRNE